MNTIDATPKRSFGDRATLCPEHYPFVNGMLRTNTFRIKKIGKPVYGKQILNDAGGARCIGQRVQCLRYEVCGG